jgi:hypothetical protein
MMVARATPAARRLTAIAAALLLCVLPTPSAGAVETSYWDGRAEASVMSFSFLMPEVAIPLTVSGGALQSTAQATATPQGFGTAGLFPVPLASSAGLVIPQVIPVLGTPIPKEIQDSLKGFDFTQTPIYCQATFPPVAEGRDEAFCGGPAQQESGLGFTAATANGHVRTTGDLDRPIETKTLAESRAQEAKIPSLQAEIFGGSSEAVSGLNGDGLPQSQARARIASLKLLGGIVTLGNVVSETKVASDGSAEATAGSTHFTVGSATILGTAVTIGPDGFSLAGQAPPGMDARALAAQVNKVAQISGFSLKLFPAPPLQSEAGRVEAESGGIELSYLTDSPTPARIVQRYGYTRASLQAMSDAFSGGGGLDGGLETPVSTASPQATFDPTNSSVPTLADTTLVGSGGADDSGGFAGGAFGGPLSGGEALTDSLPGMVGTPTPSGVGAATSAVMGNQLLLADMLSPVLPVQRLRHLYLSLLAALCGAAALSRTLRRRSSSPTEPVRPQP